jgi:glycosyltransferase 2 family protein
MFFSNFLPTSVGGDAMRLVLTPAPGRFAAVAGTILIERVTGLVVLLLLCGAGLAAAPGFVAMPAQAGAVELLVVATSAALAALLALPGPALRAAGWLAARLPEPLRRPVAAVERLTGTVAAQARNRRAVLRALLLSLPFYLTVLVGQYCALRAVDADVPIGHVLLLGATVQLMAALPISINGLGVSEGAFVGLYSALGVAPPVALAAAVVRRLVDLANSAVGGVLWLGYRRAEAGRTSAAAAVDWRGGGVPRPV